LDLLAIALSLVLGLCLGAFLMALVQKGRLARRMDEIRRLERAEMLAQVATLEERCAARLDDLTAVEAELGMVTQGQDRLRAELAQARESHVRLESLLAQERTASAEKLAFLDEARTQLANQFKALANEILEEKSQRFSTQHRSELELLLQPFGEKLQSFEKKVQETYLNEAKERFSLAEEVRKLQAANLQISQEALNLSRALKGESKTRGNWGEVILERVLERSGLEKGREYEAQFTLEGEGGKLRPDIVVRLPEDKHIVIDSKVSLVAYDRYYAAEDDVSRESALREHVQSMRRHIDQLAQKNYQGRALINTPDFVAMFVPIEPAFHLAAGRDESLYLDAFEKKVVIVTPSTLLALLSTVSTLWRRELQTRNALEIARRSGELYDKFVGFVEALRDIGGALARAQSAYDLAFARLAQGRGNLVRRVEVLRKLGARVDKPLPPDLLADALDDDDAGTQSESDEHPSEGTALPKLG
jgi:DNA recombination protein RmuC